MTIGSGIAVACGILCGFALLNKIIDVAQERHVYKRNTESIKSMQKPGLEELENNKTGGLN